MPQCTLEYLPHNLTSTILCISVVICVSSSCQVVDYAARKMMSVAEVEKWLSPVLAYDPDDDDA